MSGNGKDVLRLEALEKQGKNPFELPSPEVSGFTRGLC